MTDPSAQTLVQDTATATAAAQVFLEPEERVRLEGCIRGAARSVVQPTRLRRLRAVLRDVGAICVDESLLGHLVVRTSARRLHLVLRVGLAPDRERWALLLAGLAALAPVPPSVAAMDTLLRVSGYLLVASDTSADPELASLLDHAARLAHAHGRGVVTKKHA